MIKIKEIMMKELLNCQEGGKLYKMSFDFKLISKNKKYIIKKGTYIQKNGKTIITGKFS